MPKTEDQFAALLAKVEPVINLSSRLPELPFVARSGHVAIAEYDHLRSPEFAEVLEALAAVHGDESVTLIVADPEPSAYQRVYSFFPAFTVSCDALAAGWREGLAYRPSGNSDGAIAFSADALAVVGSTGAWSVWGEADHAGWGFALVHSEAADGPWLHTGIPFLPPSEAVESFMAPDGWRGASETEISQFLDNLGQYAAAST